MDKKKLINDYKSRKIIGGVFRLTNVGNGKYFLDSATDIGAKQNLFGFAISTGSCFDYKLKKDWEEFGPGSFRFEVLDRIE